MVVVGQLMALLEPDTHVEVISAATVFDFYGNFLQASEIACHLIHIQPENAGREKQNHLPSPTAFRSKPELLLVKKYCDALAKMSGKPTKRSTLSKPDLPIFCNLRGDKVQHVVGHAD